MTEYLDRAENENAFLQKTILELRAENANMKSVLAAYLNGEREALRAALKPFAINVGAISLSRALGHITREDLLRASRALGGKP